MTDSTIEAHRASCRFCGETLTHTVVDLGMSPLCESYLLSSNLNAMEPFYPLYVQVCGSCYLVQLQSYVTAEDIFVEYAYFSSYSDSWVEHMRQFAEAVTHRFQLGSSDLVIEIASNDGYLLQHFAPLGVPTQGIEPAKNVARVAIDAGIDTITEFFGVELANTLVSQGMTADLLIGNNVLAQVPDLNDFVEGLYHILAPQGVLTLEFPHLLMLLELNQFDTIYHEHFSYFSLLTAERILAAHSLRAFDVEEVPTHGGSLRVYACRTDGDYSTTARLASLEERERAYGVEDLATYARFREKVAETKRKLLQFLITAKEAGKSVAGYGAPGKGNTLLNYCGIREDFIDFTVDRNPYKQGRFLPGTHIPIYPPERLAEVRPDYILILPWNLEEEIISQLDFARGWGAKFVIPIPEVRVRD